MIDFLRELGVWNWFILAAILCILEAFVPGVFLIWFGVAAAIAGALALATGLGLPWQLLAFALSSVIVVVVARRFYTGDEASDGSALNARAKQYIGRTFALAEAISNGRGRMKVGDTLWTVEGPPLPAGRNVKVTGANGNVLIVVPADEEQTPDLPKAGSFS